MALPSPVVAAAAGEPGDAARRRFEVADVVRVYGQEYLRTHVSSIEQRKVLRAIAACRTSALGGHLEQCEDCSYRRITYLSCRNRHCPKCQGKERAEWMAAEQAMLLPVPYFHVVFTLPHALNPLMRVRHYGITANCQRRNKLTRCKEILAQPEPAAVDASETIAAAAHSSDTDDSAAVACPLCGGLMRVIEILAPTPGRYDTS